MKVVIKEHKIANPDAKREFHNMGLNLNGEELLAYSHWVSYMEFCCGQFSSAFIRGRFRFKDGLADFMIDDISTVPIRFCPYCGTKLEIVIEKVK